MQKHDQLYHKMRRMWLQDTVGGMQPVWQCSVGDVMHHRTGTRRLRYKQQTEQTLHIVFATTNSTVITKLKKNMQLTTDKWHITTLYCITTVLWVTTVLIILQTKISLITKFTLTTSETCSSHQHIRHLIQKALKASIIQPLITVCKTMKMRLHTVSQKVYNNFGKCGLIF